MVATWNPDNPTDSITHDLPPARPRVLRSSAPPDGAGCALLCLGVAVVAFAIYGAANFLFLLLELCGLLPLT